MPRPALRLYVAGTTGRSAAAITAVRAYVSSDLGDLADLEVVDVLHEPGRAEEDGVVATPMLIRLSPLPERRLVGDMSRTDQLRATLDR